jgi:hypothetical protein
MKNRTEGRCVDRWPCPKVQSLFLRDATVSRGRLARGPQSCPEFAGVLKCRYGNAFEAGINARTSRRVAAFAKR